MRLIAVIKATVAEFRRPSPHRPNPHHRGATFAWHALLGVVVGPISVYLFTLGIWLAAAWSIIPLVYWAVKERRDLARGGRFADGVEDAIAVGVGAGGSLYAFSAAGWGAVWSLSAFCLAISALSISVMAYEIGRAYREK